MARASIPVELSWPFSCAVPRQTHESPFSYRCVYTQLLHDRVLLRVSGSVTLKDIPVKKTAKKNALQVCLISPHPLVLSKNLSVCLQIKISKRPPDIWNQRWDRICGTCPFPKQRCTSWTLMGGNKPRGGRICFPNILGSKHVEARIIVVAEKFDIRERNCCCCKWGRQGIVKLYRSAGATSARVFPLVANGGFWVPRSVLSGFCRFSPGWFAYPAA